MINPNQKGPHKERIPQDTCINEDLPYKERSSLPRNECQLYVAIKTPRPSQTKVCIIYPNSSTLELWKFSNLTFKGYLTGIILVLSVRSSLFLFHRFCLEHVRIMRLTNNFWHHQLASFMGKKENSNSHITTSQTKICMILTCSMTTNNHTGEEPCTTALARQVQILAAAVERLTKHNHDLEE